MFVRPRFPTGGGPLRSSTKREQSASKHARRVVSSGGGCSSHAAELSCAMHAPSRTTGHGGSKGNETDHDYERRALHVFIAASSAAINDSSGTFANTARRTGARGSSSISATTETST